MSDPTTIGTWVVALFAVLGGVNLTLSIVRHFRKMPPLHEVYATIEDLDTHRHQVNEQLDKIDHRLSQMSSYSAQSREKVYTRLDQVSQQLAAIGKETELQAQFLARLDSKFDNLRTQLSQK